VYCIVAAWLRRDKRRFWAPPTFVAAIYMYYTILGPLVIGARSGFLDRNVDMLPHLTNAWLGAFVALVSWIAGYVACGWFWRPRRPQIDAVSTVTDNELLRLAIYINVIAIVGFSVTAGIDIFRIINPLSWADDVARTRYGEYSGYTGALYNYFGLAVNFLIPGGSLLMVLCLRKRVTWLAFFVCIALASSIFLFMGFRYRLVLLFGGAAFTYYLLRGRRPNPLVALGCGLAFLMIMGVIGETRRYGEGLDFTQRSRDWRDSLASAFGETSIFATSGAVISLVPDVRPFTGWESIKQTLLMPVPSQWYGAKDTMGYTRDTLMVIYGDTHYQGAAYMSFAEAYLAFGWLGVVVAHAMMGAVCRWLWGWYNQHPENPLAVLVYAAAVPYLYLVYSRGYLPQLAALFFFTVFPAIVLYRWARKRAVLPPDQRGFRRAAPRQMNLG
jgi:oligosaccharide repeat unit polymerase